MDLIRAERPVSPVMPLDESLTTWRAIDAIRAQCGVR